LDFSLDAEQPAGYLPGANNAGGGPSRSANEEGEALTMGAVGDAYDNALCERFFATLECEPLDRRRFPSQAEARMAVFEYLEGWYNPHRRRSALGYQSPVNYERSQVPIQ
jgi:putative transposase